MQNVLRFIRKYYQIFLFVILEIISFTALIRFNVYHRATFLTTSNSVSGYILNQKAEALGYFNLKDQNELLRKQFNTLLNQNLTHSYGVFGKDTFLVKDSAGIPWFSFIPAKVINNSVDKRRNYITITAGSKQGIRKNMGVISNQGVVGIVVHVSDNFALVMSMLHDQFKLKPKISGNNYFGELVWNGENPTVAKIDKISRHYTVLKNQKVVTSSYSHLFPENVPVGTVRKVVKNIRKPFSEIEVELATDFGNLSAVYVVDHKYRSEILELEGREELE